MKGKKLFLKIISIICFLIIIAIVIVFIESYRESRLIKISEYTINSSKIKCRNFKIAMISDYHNSKFPNNNKLLFDLIKKTKADIIIIAGDMITCKKNKYDKNIESLRVVNDLSKIAPVYYAFGNHELGATGVNESVGNIWNDLKSELNEDINVLVNKKQDLDDFNISIYGLSIDPIFYKRYTKNELQINEINEKLGQLDSDKFNILIAHSPEYFNTYSKWGADLILSGHNHGGLVRLPVLGGVISPKLKIFPQYDYGRFIKDKSIMILSNGLGSHTLKIRVNNKPEIVLININNDTMD